MYNKQWRIAGIILAIPSLLQTINHADEKVISLEYHRKIRI
jgi:hypothetical protein